MLLGFAAAFLPQSTCAASDTAYHVRLDISPLATLGLFNAEFQLTDGSGAGNNNSRAAISNVLLTNAQLDAVLPPTLGNVSGDLSGTLLLRDGPGNGNRIADFAQGFFVTNNALPAFFDFDLMLSYDSLESSATPDNFVFALLSGDGSQTLPTNGPTGGEVVSAAFDQPVPLAQGYASQNGSTPFLAMPLVTLVPQASTAPEPASIGLLFFGGGSLAAMGTAFGRQTRRMRRIIKQRFCIVRDGS